MANAIDDYCAYYLRTTDFAEALDQLACKLAYPNLEIAGSEYDRVATVLYEEKQYNFPVFATMLPESNSGYSQEDDQINKLEAGSRDFVIRSGIFAPVVEGGGRSGRLDGVQEELMHTRIWFDLDSNFSLITLDFLSNQRYGETEDAPRYREIHTALRDLSVYCLNFLDHVGVVWEWPPLPEQYYPEEYWLDEVDPAVEELISHHSTLPSGLLAQWPLPELSKP